MTKVKESAPTYNCTLTADGFWRFKCPRCGNTHTHSPEPGHRVAHCDLTGSHHPEGYNLVLMK